MYGKARMEMKVGLTFACMNLKKLAKIKAKRVFLDRGFSKLYAILSKIRKKEEKWLWNSHSRATLSTVWSAFMLSPKDYPTISEFYDYIQHIAGATGETPEASSKEGWLYTDDTLRRILTALYSMSYGAESCFFNGQTNLPQDRILAFGVSGLLETNRYLKNAVLFHLLSYISDKLLVQGNAAAVLDEFYLFLTALVVVEYVRNLEKRARKRDSMSS